MIQSQLLLLRLSIVFALFVSRPFFISFFSPSHMSPTCLSVLCGHSNLQTSRPRSQSTLGSSNLNQGPPSPQHPQINQQLGKLLEHLERLTSTPNGRPYLIPAASLISITQGAQRKSLSTVVLAYPFICSGLSLPSLNPTSFLELSQFRSLFFVFCFYS